MRYVYLRDLKAFARYCEILVLYFGVVKTAANLDSESTPQKHKMLQGFRGHVVYHEY